MDITHIALLLGVGIGGLYMVADIAYHFMSGASFDDVPLWVKFLIASIIVLAGILGDWILHP